jgi:hypothetical protein
MRHLLEFELEVAEGFDTWSQAGLNLLAVLDNQLYQERGFDNFHAYCLAQFGWSAGKANRLVREAEAFLSDRVRKGPLAAGKKG